MGRWTKMKKTMKNTTSGSPMKHPREDAIGGENQALARGCELACPVAFPSFELGSGKDLISLH